MENIEKVIKGLETCIPMKYETNEEKECRHDQCPYGKENYKPTNGCFWDLMSDSLALLKEQRKKSARWTVEGWCSNCKCDLPAYLIDCKIKACKTKYCPCCGARMINGTD